MNEPDPSGHSPAAVADAPTAVQEAMLRYLDVLPAEPLSGAQATALIEQLEAAPDWQPHLEAWNRDKLRLHPDLFAAPQRSFREARWWQAQITDGTHFGYSFRQPSLNQILVILESLDRQTPAWEREGKKRRQHRFMNELATLSPELCKPGCSFPHDLPPDGDEDDESTPMPTLAVRAPSAPFVPLLASPYAASAPPSAPSAPAWRPPEQPPAQTMAAAPRERSNAGKWLVILLLLLAAGVGAYAFFGFRTPAPEQLDRTDNPAAAPPSNDTARTAPAPVLSPVLALDSQRRAMDRYPDLARAGSPLNQTFVAMVHQLEVERSPKLQQPNWPERVADECAKALLIAPAKPAMPPAGSTPLPKAQATATPTPTLAAAPPAAATPASLAPAPKPQTAASSPPAAAAMVTLDAEYQEKLNTVRYRHHGAPEEATVAVTVHNMARGGSAKFTVRCVFFKRPTGHADRRKVLSSSEKQFEVAAGEKFSDSFESAEVYRGPGATEEFDGWLVQLLPEGGDRFIKQIGSTGTIEDLGKTMKF